MPNASTGPTHSEEVDDLIGRVPAWVLRWGSGTLLLIVVGLLVGAWTIEYPDVVAAPVTMTTESPPVPLVARGSGRLRELWVADGDVVEPGAWLAVIENPARTDDVRALGRLLRDTQLELAAPENFELDGSGLRKDATLGELQVEHAAFVAAWRDYVATVRDPYYADSVASVHEQLETSEALARSIHDQRRGFEADLAQAEREARAASRLLAQGVLSGTEHAEAETEVRERRRALDAAAVELLGQQLTRRQLARGGLDLDHERAELVRSRLRAVYDRHAELGRAYEAWQRDYVLVAPIAGQVALHRVWSTNQWVDRDEEVMTIVPSLDEVVGRVELGQRSSGKVEVGQRVIIKLDGYPYREFGVVRGEVASVPAISREDTYLVTVRLPDGLRTSHDHALVLRHDMRGTAEIVTAELRLLERMFFQLTSLLEDR